MMGRLIGDFKTISRGMGWKNAVRLVLLPRVMPSIGVDYFAYSKAVSRFIEAEFGSIVSKYKDVRLSDLSTDIPEIIWVFWWQGEKEMPSVIKICYESICKNANGRNVILLSQDNYDQYVLLPSIILEKFEKKIIGFPHFSDILRLLLLIQYGGVWIDAGCFVTRPIEQYRGFFFSPKLSKNLSNAPHLSQWVMGIMGVAPNMPLMCLIKEILIDYWSKFNVSFSYLMFDYFIRYSFEHLDWVRQIMMNREVNSPDIHESRYLFAKEVDYNYFDYLINNNTFLSLTYRIPYPLRTEYDKDTYYATLLRTFNLS